MAKKVTSRKQLEPSRRWSAAPGEKESWRRITDELSVMRIKLAKDLLLPKAIAGERWAALRIIAIAGEVIGDGSPISDSSPREDGIADWLSAVLCSIAGGETVEDAAGIPKRPKGTKKERVAADARGRRYFMAHQYGARFKHERMKGAAAAAEVAKLFGVEVETVLSAWKKHRKLVIRDIENEVRDLGKVFKIISPPM